MWGKYTSGLLRITRELALQVTDLLVLPHKLLVLCDCVEPTSQFLPSAKQRVSVAYRSCMSSSLEHIL
jgi:hypothetical protein